MSYHLKFSFQLKPPQVMSDAVTYSNDSSEITSIIGHTTIFLFYDMSIIGGMRGK